MDVVVAACAALSVLWSAPEVSCSYYAGQFHGRTTASGLVYDMEEMTCAHRDLPLGSLVLFTSCDGGASAVLRVTDRGPYVDGRDFDLSRAAFVALVGDTLCGVSGRNGAPALRAVVVGRDTSGMLYNL